MQTKATEYSHKYTITLAHMFVLFRPCARRNEILIAAAAARLPPNLLSV